MVTTETTQWQSPPRGANCSYNDETKAVELNNEKYPDWPKVSIKQLYFSSKCPVPPLEDDLQYSATVFWALGELANEENTDKDGVTTINERGLKPGYMYVTPYVESPRVNGRQCENAIQDLLGEDYTITYLNEKEACCDCFRIKRGIELDFKSKENQDWNNGYTDGAKTMENSQVFLESIIQVWSDEGGNNFKFSEYVS